MPRIARALFAHNRVTVRIGVDDSVGATSKRASAGAGAFLGASGGACGQGISNDADGIILRPQKRGSRRTNSEATGACGGTFRRDR